MRERAIEEAKEGEEGEEEEEGSEEGERLWTHQAEDADQAAAVGAVAAEQHGHVAVHVDVARRVAVLDAVARVRPAGAAVGPAVLERLEPLQPDAEPVRVGRDGVGRRVQELAVLGEKVVVVGLRADKGGEGPARGVRRDGGGGKGKVVRVGDWRGRRSERDDVAGDDLTTLRYVGELALVALERLLQTAARREATGEERDAPVRRRTWLR